jgi:ABC-type multidrug transport system ATPase subunit
MDCLQADSIVKNYGTLRVLSDIHISCKSGEVVGLVGRNGSGKSTLLKIIFGSLGADQKYVKANETQIVTLADSIKQIKYLPQDNFLPKNYKIEKLLRLFKGSLNLKELCSDPLVSGLLDRKPGQLSGGERRLVEILIIIYSKAGYLLLDEPFNGIAPIHKERIKTLIKEKATDKGIIITDHDYKNVLEVSNRIVMIYDGGTRNIKDPKELELWGYLPGKE